ncbi:hypothetical protein HaLaN_25168, partial [Haematococcus lacustris]
MPGAWLLKAVSSAAEGLPAACCSRQCPWTGSGALTPEQVEQYVRDYSTSRLGPGLEE